MSDFKFVLPIIPYNSALSASGAVHADYPVLNTRGGSLTEGVKSATSTTEFAVIYNLTTNMSGNVLVLSNIRGLIEADGASIGLRYYYQNSSTFNGYTVALADLVGPQQKDYVRTITANSEVYFQIRVITANAMFHDLGKIFFGTAFEFDREPLTVDIRDLSIEHGERQKGREFQIVFEGITPAKKTEFVETVVPYCKHTPIFLWDSQDRLFFGDELLYANLVDYRCKPNMREVWTVETTWREAI